jgi:hypothetical protein
VSPMAKRKAGRPRITPPGAGPARRLVVSDLGPYAGRCLAEIKAVLAASKGEPVTDADVIRFALARVWEDIERFKSPSSPASASPASASPASASPPA